MIPLSLYNEVANDSMKVFYDTLQGSTYRIEGMQLKQKEIKFSIASIVDTKNRWNA